MSNRENAAQPPDELKPVLVNLRIDHEAARTGVRLADAPARSRPLAVLEFQRELVRQRVSDLIMKPLTREAHFALVEEVFGGRPELVAVPWRVRDPYGLDPEKAVPARALEAAFGGPSALSDEELALLLLDEDTLTNFALLAHREMPDWWLDALAELGRGAEAEPEPDLVHAPERRAFDTRPERPGRARRFVPLVAGAAVVLVALGAAVGWFARGAARPVVRLPDPVPREDGPPPPTPAKQYENEGEWKLPASRTVGVVGSDSRNVPLFPRSEVRDDPNRAAIFQDKITATCREDSSCRLVRFSALRAGARPYHVFVFLRKDHDGNWIGATQFTTAEQAKLAQCEHYTVVPLEPSQLTADDLAAIESRANWNPAFCAQLRAWLNDEERARDNRGLTSGAKEYLIQVVRLNEPTK